MLQKRQQRAAAKTGHIHRKGEPCFILPFGQHTTEGLQRACRCPRLSLNCHAGLAGKTIPVAAMTTEHPYLKIH